VALRITGMNVYDVRFPTSRTLAGSDAMNLDPDYSCAYVVLRTDSPDGLAGHGLTFTIGRGTDLCVAAARALAPFVVGMDAGELFGDLGGFWRRITGDSQLRWIGPEKGVIHLATAAVVNAVWDLYAKHEGVPLWALLARMAPREIVDLVDFRYLRDALDEEEATDRLAARLEGRDARRAELERDGYPAYVTSVGWMGYDESRVRDLCELALGEGWRSLKMKVGRSPEDDARRAALIRSVVGDDARLMMDANQVWDVPEAIERTKALARFDPYWMEEPTSPDDVLGHATIARAVAPIRVATGEHAHNRVMFKQLMQAGAIGVCQLDACRLAGVNEAVAVLLLADRFGVPVCPHAGGVGLCEYVQHLSAFDYIAVSGSLDGRMTEYAEHLHEHFVDPARVAGGRYLLPSQPGYSAELHPSSLDEHVVPHGRVWAAG
jgi:L-fuconate dehydratase